MDSPSHAHLPQSFEHFEMNNEGRAFMLTRDKGSQEDFLSMFHPPSKELQSFRSKHMDPISSSVLARLLRRLPLRRSRDRVYVFRSLIVYNTIRILVRCSRPNCLGSWHTLSFFQIHVRCLIASSPSASARSIAASGRIEMHAIAQHG